jgi:hypothetical protein
MSDCLFFLCLREPAGNRLHAIIEEEFNKLKV